MSLLTVFPQKCRLQESCNLSKPHQWICTTTITTATTSCFRHNSHHNNHNKRAWIHLDHSCEKCEISRNFFRIFSTTLHHHCTPHLFLFFLVLLQPPFLLFHVFYPSTPTTLKKVGLFLWYIYFLSLFVFLLGV